MKQMNKVQSLTSNNAPQHGFSLIELMVVIALLVILVTIGVPSFQQIITQNRAAAISNDLLYHLQLARSEAVRLSQRVSICPVTLQDQEECSNSSDWNKGWIMFLDANGNGVFEPSTDTIVRVAPAPNQLSTFSGPTSITFQPAGSGSVGAFSLALGGDAERWVCVELSGRAAVSKTACS